MKNLTIKTDSAALSVLATETCLTGKLAVETITMPATAGATEGDFIIIPDTNGVSWGVCLDKNGGGVANAGALYTAINTALKMAIVNISGLVGAPAVATACVTALNLLVGFTTAFTLIDVGDGTITVTSGARGVMTVMLPKDAAETGVGTITAAVNVVGVLSAINATTNVITLATTTFVTGTEVTVSISSGTLPAPVTAGNYYIIKTGTSAVKLAWTYAQAIAGIAVNITDQGTADKTITIKGAGQKGYVFDISGVLVISIQVNINYAVVAADALGAIALEVSNDGVRWAPVASSSQSFTLAADVLIFEVQLNSNYVRTSTTITSGGNGTLFQTFVAEKIMPGY